MNNTTTWEIVKNENPGKQLIFLHIPKCGGTTVRKILLDLNIKYRCHKEAIKNTGINFAIVRHPVNRFESLLNYRLSKERPRDDWPKHLHYLHYEKNISLNEIVSEMIDNEIIGFKPFNTLLYWSNNVDIFITIDQLSSFLNVFGYTYDEYKYKRLNVSPKTRGTFNDETIKRIETIFKDDILFYNSVIKE